MREFDETRVGNVSGVNAAELEHLNLVSGFGLAARGGAAFPAQALLDARFGEAIQDLDDDAALFRRDRRWRGVVHRRRDLLKRKSRHQLSPLR